MKRMNQSTLLFYSLVISCCCIFVTHSSNSSSTTTFSCLPHQSSVLLQLKGEFALKQPDEHSFLYSHSKYPKMRNWKAGSDCCLWDGVACNMATGHVVSLDLSGSWLRGPLRSNSSLFSLVHLRKLNLAMNDFNSCPIPSELGQLSRLTHLNLSHSSFHGDIPSEISMLTNLMSLDLSCWPFGLYIREGELERLIHNTTNLILLYLDFVNLSSSPVPQSIANLSSLTHLSVRNCYLYGEFPQNIFQLPNIQSIDLSHNIDLTGSLPEFNSTSHLESLVILRTSFSGKLPDSIGNLKSLNVLHLKVSSFTGIVPSSLWNLSELVDVDLFHNHITGQLPSTLGKLAKLTSLKLDDNEFSGQIPSSLGNLTKLTHFSIYYNSFQGKFPAKLPYLIQSLSFGYNKLTGSIPSHNLNLTFLQSLDLPNCFFSGVIPSSLFTLPSLQSLNLDHNQFTDLDISNSSKIEILALGGNKLNGVIPSSLSKLQKLRQLFLDSNNFSGRVDFGIFSELSNLHLLDLSYNSHLSQISVDTNSTLPKFKLLFLTSCNISEFPDFLKTQDELVSLSLSGNRIDSLIPSWFFSIGRNTLQYLSLSENLISGWEEIPLTLPWKELRSLHMHSNMMQGPLVVPPISIQEFYISNNSLTGEIDPLFCKLSNLEALDASSNHLSGTIPQCLGSLQMLNLRYNNFMGNIPQICRDESLMRILDLSHNQLQGKIPQSLINCKDLLVLNLGHNQISDAFPFWLQSLPKLHILMLGSNKLHGPIWHIHNSFSFLVLIIIDISHNDFAGSIPSEYFRNWTSMTPDVSQKYKSGKREVLSFMQASWYKLDSVTVTNKGQQMEVIQNVDIFVSIDLSSNKFHGEIPSTIWDLQSLVMLNLSNNNFTGFIPSSLGNLRQLQSLDLSNNKLSGKIPQQLTSLTFLAYLNLSQNQLVGPIPQGGQVWTFQNSSFEGNLGLCDFPLSRKCGTAPPTSSISDNHDSEKADSIFDFGWKVVAVGYGCGLLVGLVIGLVFTSRRPNFIFKIFGLRL